jgi:hypothetical protein
LAGNGLVDEGLPVLLQQFDLPLPGMDNAPNPPVHVLEEADDGGLFGEGWYYPGPIKGCTDLHERLGGPSA